MRALNLITIAVSHGRIISVEGQSFANDGKKHGAFAGTNPRLLSWTTSTSSTLRRSTLMLPTIAVWGHVLDIGLVLLLAYLVVLWLASWVLESLARRHFHRAQRYAHTRFAYDVELDRYECPQGELLTLHTFDDRNKLAIYKAPAASCNQCVLKAFCTTRDEGRHVFRTLTEFHETDIGRFHRWLSLIILVVALVFSTGGVFSWWNRPGGWLLAIATAVNVILLWLDLRDTPEKLYRNARRIAAGASLETSIDEPLDSSL